MVINCTTLHLGNSMYFQLGEFSCQNESLAQLEIYFLFSTMLSQEMRIKISRFNVFGLSNLAGNMKQREQNKNVELEIVTVTLSYQFNFIVS